MSQEDDNPWPKDKLVEEEDRRVLYLQGLVDSAIFKIMTSSLSRTQALDLVSRIRVLAGELFPDSLGTFDLLFLKRFERAISEYTHDDQQ